MYIHCLTNAYNTCMNREHTVAVMCAQELILVIGLVAKRAFVHVLALIAHIPSIC